MKTCLADNKSRKKNIVSESIKENIKIFWYKFSKNKLSVVGLSIVILTMLLALFASYIAPYPEHVKEYVDYDSANLPPNSTNLFGTDIFGRDMLTRVIFSFRDALLMGIIVLVISVPIGTFLGLIAGYYSGTWIESTIMRTTDIFLALPPLLFALAIASVLEPGFKSSVSAITVLWWPWYTRVVYGMAQSIKNEYFVKNAELIGASKVHILIKEILPNCLSPVFTKMALDVGWIILIGASLSFVGLGEQPPKPAFGQMISDGVRYMPEFWWMVLFPALGVAFTILGFNFLGDGMRDALDKGVR